VALVEQRRSNLPKREPAQFVFGRDGQLSGEVGPEEDRLHPVVPALVGGVEELRRLADPVSCPTAGCI
jgi:hypothetical protein